MEVALTLLDKYVEDLCFFLSKTTFYITFRLLKSFTNIFAIEQELVKCLSEHNCCIIKYRFTLLNADHMLGLTL